MTLINYGTGLPVRPRARHRLGAHYALRSTTASLGSVRLVIIAPPPHTPATTRTWRATTPDLRVLGHYLTLPRAKAALRRAAARPLK